MSKAETNADGPPRKLLRLDSEGDDGRAACLASGGDDQCPNREEISRLWAAGGCALLTKLFPISATVLYVL